VGLIGNFLGSCCGSCLPTENPESEEQDAELIVVAQGVADGEHPFVVAGDLNDVAWSATTRRSRKIMKFFKFQCRYSPALQDEMLNVCVLG
jgi:endonuclease/exonuclease/phosphatase (EEP) superfamily protein YafD